MTDREHDDQVGHAPPVVPRLASREIGDDRIALAVHGHSCPLCVLQHRNGRGYLESIIWENVNDGPFRERLLRGGGFCPRHGRLVAQVERDLGGGALGVAILGRAVLRSRLAALDRPTRRSRRENPLELATRHAADCPACEQEKGALLRAIGRMLDLAAADPAWLDAVGRAAFCLAHLGILLGSKGSNVRPEVVAAIRSGQLERLNVLVDRLDGFISHSSYDRRHLLAEDERQAVAEMVALLSGAGETQR